MDKTERKLLVGVIEGYTSEIEKLKKERDAALKEVERLKTERDELASADSRGVAYIHASSGTA